MKIKNEYIEIKKGNKFFTKRNMILDTYLHQIFNSQIAIDHDTTTISYCYVKFDTPLENINYNSEVDPTDYFDVILWSFRSVAPVIKTSNNLIKLIYKFSTQNFRMYYNGESWLTPNDKKFNMFAGRKVTAIGFGSYNKLFAYLDTSNMNIIINENENLQITRVDSIQSDGIVKDYDYPLHLAQDVINKTVVGRENKLYAQLYSIGFGNIAGYMEEEYLIGDVTTGRDNNSITLEVNRTKKVGHYPSENLHLGFYPTIDNSKLLIFKYRLYQRELRNGQYVTVYLDKYYTMNMPNENSGDLQIKLSIERM